jgi:hypothetical protein
MRENEMLQTAGESVVVSEAVKISQHQPEADRPVFITQ